MLTGVGGRTGLRSTHVAHMAHVAGRLRGTPVVRGTRGKRTGRPRRLAGAVALGVALAALFLLSLRQSLTSPLSSDGASNILQAQAMLHGNPLLRGWWTSDVSFYTTELPEYALMVAARGLSPDVVHVCGALTYTLTVALAGLLARGRAPGAAGLRRAGIAVAIMLAPSVLGGTEVFLENPDHFGTSVPVLLVLLLLDGREGRDEVAAPRWSVPVAVCALLAWTQVGDELSLAAATAPIAAVCAFRLAVAVIRRRPRAELRRDGLPAAAALISVVVARIAERALRAIGGFDQRPIPGTRLASLGQLPGNARVLWQSVVLLFGANNPGRPRRAITISRHVPLVLSADLHVIGLVVAGAGLVAGIAVGFFGWAGPVGDPGPAGPGDRVGWVGRDRVGQILVTAIGVTIAAGLFSTLMQSLTSAHEVAILLPLAAVLAGRTLPSSARRLVQRLAEAQPGRARGPGVRAPAVREPSARVAAATTAATVALAGWLAVGASEAGDAAVWPASPVPVQNVAAWLVAHHLHDGLAAYWQGTETTVASGGRVLVAPVTDSGAAAAHWEASSAWYQPSRHRATFVIAELHPANPEDSLAVASVRARFGRPAAEYRVGGDIVLVYRYNLLTRLHGRTFPGPP
jgi:hypothetical protein